MSALSYEIERGTRVIGAIGAAVGDRLFTSSELIAHCDINLTLRTALERDLGSLNCRRLGKYLRLVEDATFDGITVRRRGKEREGLVWVCEFAAVITTSNSPRTGMRHTMCATPSRE